MCYSAEKLVCVFRNKYFSQWRDGELAPTHFKVLVFLKTIGALYSLSILQNRVMQYGKAIQQQVYGTEAHIVRHSAHY